MLAFLRVIRFAFQDIFRNFSLSFMTVLILVLMLLSINTLIVIRVLTNEATASVKDKIDVTVYFDHEVTEEDIFEVREYVESFPEVVAIDYSNKQKVLEDFRAQHSDNPEIIESIDELGENPLGPTMVIKTRQPSDYQKIITSLAVPFSYPHSFNAYMPLPSKTNFSSLINSLCTVCAWALLSIRSAISVKCNGFCSFLKIR